MTGMITRAGKRASTMVKRWSAEAPARRFMAFCQRKWPRRPGAESDSVVLVGLLASNPSIFCYAYVTNHLAEKHGSRIESYQFGGRVSPLLRKLYESFGARFGLSMANAAPQESRIQAEATEICTGLKTKADVVNIAVDGVILGDQIYDSYLRFFNEPTVRLDDPRLREIVVQALRIFHATRDYLARNRVTAFITNDFSYITNGVATRLMFLAKVPIYVVSYGEPFSLIEVDPKPSGVGHNFPPPYVHRYYSFPELFAKMTVEEKADALETGRQALEERLSGKFCPLVNMPGTTYAVSDKRVLDEGPEPRILVMMHDFVDSPHCYRDMLFPDYVEWIRFLLKRAAETPFRWYVKPHPCTADMSGDSTRKEMSEANNRIVAQLAREFPEVTFLDATTSNQQILNDGVTAMFSVCGTAGHEFAYRGVPAVNCGDNPHIAYDFNIHARTIEEYEGYIRNADRLQVTIDKRAIEECVFMYYFYHSQKYGSPCNPIDERIFADPAGERRANQLTAFDEFIAGVTPERERGVTEYLNRFFSQPS